MTDREYDDEGHPSTWDRPYYCGRTLGRRRAIRPRRLHLWVGGYAPCAQARQDDDRTEPHA